MPHCIIEYSKTLNTRVEARRLVEVVHKAVLESALFEPSHIRVRACVYEEHVIGYPVHDFIHVTLKILCGRTQQQKKDLAERVLGELDSIGLTSISLSVEVVDIERETYSRKIVASP